MVTGGPDATMTSFGIHAGARFGMGSSVLTPYADLDWTETRLKAFTETGMPGANLTVSGKEHRKTLTGGVKFATQLGGGFVPELTLGWRHRFGATRSAIDAAFLGDATGFRIVSQEEKRDAALVGLSLGGRVGAVDVRIGYEGVFAGRQTDHVGSFRIVLPLGGGRR